MVNVPSTAQALDIKGLSDKSSLDNEVHVASSPKITQSISLVPGFEPNPFPIKKQQTLQSSIRISEEGSNIKAKYSSHLPKQEILKEAEDLNKSRSEQNGYKDGAFDSVDSFNGVGKDMVYIDTSIVAVYGDDEHDDEAMDDIEQQNVSFKE